MGWLQSLFGIKPERRSAVTTGFFWQRRDIPAVAAGKGWTQQVVGESFYRAALERLSGGATIYGVTVSKAATLIVGEYEGKPAVYVEIDGELVGSIPKDAAEALHREILAIAPAGSVSVKGSISAGFEGGDYSVRLSLARPLRVRLA